MKNTLWTSILLALAATSCAQLGDSSSDVEPMDTGAPVMDTSASTLDIGESDIEGGFPAMGIGATPAVAWRLPVLEVLHADSSTSTAQMTMEIFHRGTGEVVESGNHVEVHYQGWVLNTATTFDSSYDRNQPIAFPVGTGRVIEGWDTALVGMKVGTKARLVIPSEMAYGPDGRPPVIPPGATLVFEIEVMGAL